MTTPNARITASPVPGQRSAMRGQVLIIFALASFVLIGFVALSIDTGFLMAERRQVQNAADVAALAAAKSLFDGNTAQITASAQSYGVANADVPAGNVVVNWPPVSGAYVGHAKYVQVTITKDVEKFFVGAMYTGPWQVAATATAGIDQLRANIAMLALNPDAGGIRAVGNAGISATGDEATIMSNYTLDLTGNVNVSASGYVNANDGFDTTGNITVQGALGESENTPEVPDPLVGTLSAPAIPNCPGRDDAGISVSGNNSETILPGTHVFHGDGISLTGNSTLNIASGDHEFWFCDGASFRMAGNQRITKGVNTRVTMHFIDGNGLRLTGNSSWSLPRGEYYFVDSNVEYTGNSALTRTDVFFYFSGDASMRSTGNGSFGFTAPSTEVYPGYLPGILVFADWNNTETFRWVGNSGTSSGGAIYLPSATMEMVGNSSGRIIQGQLIADRFSFTGNANISVQYQQVIDLSNPRLFLVE